MGGEGGELVFEFVGGRGGCVVEFAAMFSINFVPILGILRDVFLRVGTKVPCNKRLPELGELPGDLGGVLFDEAQLSGVLDATENGLDMLEEEGTDTFDFVDSLNEDLCRELEEGGGADVIDGDGVDLSRGGGLGLAGEKLGHYSVDMCVCV